MGSSTYAKIPGRIAPPTSAGRGSVAEGHGTGVNAKVKNRVLPLASETLGGALLAFKTDVLNARFRAAIRKLRTHEKTVLPRHMIVQ